MPLMKRNKGFRLTFFAITFVIGIWSILASNPNIKFNEVFIRTVGSSSTPSELWSINIKDCTTEKINNTGTSGIGSMAKRSKLILYAINYSNQLVTIDAKTGSATVKATVNINDSIRALTYKNDMLYAISKDSADQLAHNKLYSIDINSGQATLIKELDTRSVQALVSTEGPHTYAYGWEMRSGFYSRMSLVRIDLNTGAVTDIDPNDNGYPSPSPYRPSIQTMAFSSDGTLYGIGNGNIHTINTTTGEPTRICTGMTQGDGIGSEFVLISDN